MKKLLALLLAMIMVFAMFAGCGKTETPPASDTPDTASEPPVQSEEPEETDEPEGEVVELTMGSWRTDDVAQMNALIAAYEDLNPNVKITFQPTNPPDYNSTIRMQLEGGQGPDLMYARSYDTGQALFSEGYFADCTDIPGLMDNFTAANREPWQMPGTGEMFAVPFAAVSHAVYYNKDIFAELELEIPETWDDFLAVCAAVQDAGYTALANGVADEWDILECFYLGMLPNYIGGAEERLKYQNGEKPLNDQPFVDAFEDMAKAAPYLPEGFEAITYNDSQVLFNTGMAAMFIDGSWTCGVYEDAAFDWGLFAIPARNADDTAICFHPDMAITMNAATPYPEESMAFLEWLCTEAGATVASENLPIGYFPMIDFSITLGNAQANEFLALNEGRETDARFIWPAFMDLYSPMNQAVISVLKGDATPQAAADSVKEAYEAGADAVDDSVDDEADEE